MESSQEEQDTPALVEDTSEPNQKEDHATPTRGSLISDRMKWLDEQNKKEQERPNNNTEATSQSYGGSVIADRMKWLDEQNQKKPDTPKQDKVEGVTKGLAAEKAKWLQGGAFKADSFRKDSEEPRRSQSYGGSLIADRMSWLDGQGKKKEFDGPRQDKVEGVQKGLAAEKAKWLQSGAKSEKDSPDKKEKEEIVSQSYGGSLIADRMSWLDEQGKKKEFDGPRQDKIEGVQKGLAAEKAKWLQSGAKSENDYSPKKKEQDEIASQSYGGSLIADRMSWLDEQGKKKEFDGPRQDNVEGVQRGLAAEKAKWLESGAKNENEAGAKQERPDLVAASQSYGGSLIADRMSWLDEQGKKKEFDGPRQDNVEGVQKGLAAEKAKWLESGAKNENDDDTKDKRPDLAAASQSYGGSLIADRMSWLDEQGKQKEFDGPRQDKIEGVQKGLAAEKAKWLESGAKNENEDDTKDGRPDLAAASQSYGGSLIADRMSWLDEQGKKKEFDGPRQDKIEGVQKGLAAEKAKWLESGAKNEDDGAEKEEKEEFVSQSYGGSLIADRMSWLDEQGKKKEFDGPRQDNVEGVQKGLAAEKAKWLESGAKNENDTEEERPDLVAASQSYGGSLIADRMSWLDEQGKHKEFDGPRQDTVEGIQEGLAADRSKWLENASKTDL